MQIDQAKCIKCATCQSACPMQAIENKDGFFVINKEKCVGCCICMGSCPANAISQ